MTEYPQQDLKKKEMHSYQEQKLAFLLPHKFTIAGRTTPTLINAIKAGGILELLGQNAIF